MKALSSAVSNVLCSLMPLVEAGGQIEVCVFGCTSPAQYIKVLPDPL